MKIAIPCADLLRQRVDGTQIYLENVLRHFAQKELDADFYLYYPAKPQNGFAQNKRFSHHVLSWRHFWTQTRLPLALFSHRPDVLWMPQHTLPLLRPKMRVAATIHDLAWFYFPQYFTKKNLLLLRFFTRYAAGTADKLIAVSQATKNDLIKFYHVPEDKIRVIHHGFDEELFRPMRSKEDCEKIEKLKTKLNITKPYILFIGAIQPRKNIIGLIKAFNLIKKREGLPHQLVIVGGKGWLWQQTITEKEKSFFKNEIIFTEQISRENLPVILWGADSFVLPSFYEGFGLPVLEALACGTPVLASDISSLPEVVGEAGILFNPKNIEEMAGKILRVLKNPELRLQLGKKGMERAKKFSWQKCANETLSLLQSF